MATASRPGGDDRASAGAPAPNTQPRRPAAWQQRYGRLYEELRRPARAMVKRAFGRAFGEAEIEDLYGNAWLGTLRALERRQEELSDGELRKYVLTAVANQASKELRRRGRRPTAPLDNAASVPDDSALPDDRTAQREESRVARDVLGTLPARRRAVMLFRYGWGLEPSEVCGLIKGLSPRAYRKEITRGVDEISAKLRLVEEGRWCGNREPILKAYAAGLADEEQRRQAEHHLAHCRPCSEYVGKLNGHLHEIGSSIAWPAAADAVGGERVAFGDRLGDVAERARESALGVLGRGGSEPAETAAQAAASGGGRGAGVGAAGGLAKLAGVGAVPKLIATCVGTGAAATACVAAGVAPVQLPDTSGEPAAQRPASEQEAPPTDNNLPPTLPSQIGNEAPEPVPRPNPEPTSPPVPEPAPAPAPQPAPAPPVQQEFGLAPASPSGSGSAPSTGTDLGSGSSSGAVQQEFGGP